MGEDKESPETTTSAGERIEIEFRDDDDELTSEPPVVEAAAAKKRDSVGDEIARLREEFEQLREMYLRKLAEFDNYRKRTEREREEFRQIAAEGVIRELLPVVDNFERALDHAGNGDPEAFRDGIEMIARQLWELLEREGLAVVDPDGQPFEPEFHEAVQRVEDSGHDPGTVVSVLSKGYTLGGRLIRPAMVSVAVEATNPPTTKASGDGSRDQGGNSS